MDNCIFCKIVNGEIPSITLFEDEDVKVIFDIGPATKGHAIVITKEHFANVFEITDEALAKAHIAAKKVATVLKEKTGCAGVNILQNNGEKAGQTVFHLHIHIIPRYEDDTAKITWTPGSIDGYKEYLEELAASVKSELSK